MDREPTSDDDPPHPYDDEGGAMNVLETHADSRWDHLNLLEQTRTYPYRIPSARWTIHVGREYAAIMKRTEGFGVLKLVTGDLAALRPHWDSMQEWTAALLGPPGSPYEDGIFTMRLTLADNHPWSPPTVTFVERIYHPNVHHRSGACWADLLVRGGQTGRASGWQPSYTLEGIMTQLAMLLREPTFNRGCWRDIDGVDALMVTQVQLGIDDPATWAAEARRWTSVHARPAPCAHHAAHLIIVGANLARSYGGEGGDALLHVWSTSIVGHALREDFLRMSVEEARDDARQLVTKRVSPALKMPLNPNTRDDMLRLDVLRVTQQDRARQRRVSRAEPNERWYPRSGVDLLAYLDSPSAPLLEEECLTCRLPVCLARYELDGRPPWYECRYCSERHDSWPVNTSVKTDMVPLCRGERLVMLYRARRALVVGGGISSHGGAALNPTAFRVFLALPRDVDPTDDTAA